MELVKTTDFKNIYNDMLSQFPPEELKSFEKFQKIFGKNYCAYDVVNGGTPVGYVILFESRDFIFIDYVAIFKEFHSNGFGGMVLETLKEKFAAKKGCFLEVEKPDEQEPNTLRRIKFYQKHGAGKLGVNYLYPNENGALPMDLYYIPYGSLPEDMEIKEFITELFRIVHFDIAHASALLERIFEN